MKKAIFFAFLWFFLVAAPHAAGRVYPVIEVEDGDTLVVEIGGAPKRIQLAAIDAPEAVPNPKFQHDLERTRLPREVLLALGRAATAHLKTRVRPGDHLVLEGDLNKKDRYGRIAVQVFDADGRSLNEVMVADGFARMYSRTPVESALGERLMAAQAQALAAGRGLWGRYAAAARAWAGITP